MSLNHMAKKSTLNCRVRVQRFLKGSNRYTKHMGVIRALERISLLLLLPIFPILAVVMFTIFLILAYILCIASVPLLYFLLVRGLVRAKGNTKERAMEDLWGYELNKTTDVRQHFSKN